jgi:hypothetical protein
MVAPSRTTRICSPDSAGVQEAVLRLIAALVGLGLAGGLSLASAKPSILQSCSSQIVGLAHGSDCMFSYIGLSCSALSPGWL